MFHRNLDLLTLQNVYKVDSPIYTHRENTRTGYLGGQFVDYVTNKLWQDDVGNKKSHLMILKSLHEKTKKPSIGTRSQSTPLIRLDWVSPVILHYWILIFIVFKRLAFWQCKQWFIETSGNIWKIKCRSKSFITVASLISSTIVKKHGFRPLLFWHNNYSMINTTKMGGAACEKNGVYMRIVGEIETLSIPCNYWIS